MKILKKKIKMMVGKTETGFSAYSDEYSVFTTGVSLTELLHNAVKATNLFLSDQNSQITENNIEFEIDLQQFFQYYRVINSKFLAKHIGMNESLLSQYVQGRKKPSAAQTHKILQGLRRLDESYLI